MRLRPITQVVWYARWKVQCWRGSPQLDKSFRQAAQPHT